MTSSSRRVRGSEQTIYLASSLAAVPPSIVAVRGSREASPSRSASRWTLPRSQNIHNYAVKFSPSQQFSLAELTGVGLIQTLDNTKQSIALRRASYDAATNTVTLVAERAAWAQTGRTRSATRRACSRKRNRPNKAHALTDLQGNPLDEGEATPASSRSRSARDIRTRRRRPFSRTEVDRDGRLREIGRTSSARRPRQAAAIGTRAVVALGCGVPRSLGLTWMSRSTPEATRASDGLGSYGEIHHGKGTHDAPYSSQDRSVL